MHCKSCRSKLSKNKFFFGKNYQSNIFEKKKIFYKNYKKINLILAECRYCNLIQILKPLNYKEIIPSKKWIVNKEEDKHHKNFAEFLGKKNILKKTHKILLLSQYDSKFFEFLKKKNYKSLYNLDLRKFLKKKNKNYFRQEFIQNFLNLNIAKKINSTLGSFDFIICSKLLEHTQNVKNFFLFCRQILTPNGYLLIDVPDCEKSLKQGNIAMPWEEHISYFTTKTLNNTTNNHKFKKIFYKNYFYKQENALVGLYQKKFKALRNVKKKEVSLLIKYRKKANKFNTDAQLFFKKKSNFKFYIFGAGHNAIFFFNFLKLSNKNFEIIDDNQNKNNCIFAGSSKRIKNSESLMRSKDNKIILLTVNIEIEAKIIKKLKSKLKKKDKIFSIYPDSRRFFLKNF